jgi:hypothetical protein
MATLGAVDLIFTDSISRAGYGLLSAWWVTLYVALLLRTTWRALPVFLSLMALVLVIDDLRGTGFLYHDAPPIGTAAFLVVLAGLLLLWASPVVVNEIATRVRNRFVNAHNAS